MQKSNPCHPNWITVSTILYPYNGSVYTGLHQLDKAPISYTGNPVFLAEHDAYFLIKANYSGSAFLRVLVKDCRLFSGKVNCYAEDSNNR